MRISDWSSDVGSSDLGTDVPTGQRELSVDIGIDGDRLSLQFSDDGAPFDPTATAAPNLDADIDDRPIGGLGLHLIKQLAEEISYRRDGGFNKIGRASCRDRVCK